MTSLDETLLRLLVIGYWNFCIIRFVISCRSIDEKHWDHQYLIRWARYRWWWSNRIL